MGEDLDQLVEELGAVLAAPDLPRLQRTNPGADKKWKAGDIAARMSRAMLDAVAERLSGRVEVTGAQLRSYADVAAAYPPEERTVQAAWTVYRELRDVPRDRRREILHDGLKLRPAREAIGKGPMDRVKKERESDEVRAWFVIDELQEPGVRAIVEKEMRDNAADRKARRAVKTALDEIAAEKKRIETQLKKLAKEGTPERQFWETSKNLTEAERFIYSVARLHDRHGDAMEPERWADIAEKLRHVATSAEDVAARVEGPSYDDVIEAEVLPDFLELSAGDDGTPEDRSTDNGAPGTRPRGPH
jgi:hypothetical protein